MKRHVLKCWPTELWAIRRLLKTCEVRRADDREFAVDDELELWPWDPELGAFEDAPGVLVAVTHMTRSAGPANLFTLIDAPPDASGDYIAQREVPIVVLSFRMLNTFLPPVAK